MEAKQLPARPSLEQYKKQAKDLLESLQVEYAGGDRAHPETRSWFCQIVARRSGGTQFVLADAQLVIAREHGFESWPRFAKHIEELTRASSPISNFEAAAGAVVAGDLAILNRLLRQDPGLARARSSRTHAAPLLHYVSGNGVEDYRQKTPANAVEVANTLLAAGAEVDAASDAYGGKATALGLVATSVHPWRAGVQIALLETLLDAGANIDGVAEGWTPLVAALRNGRGEAAEFLAQRGARLDLDGAAGVGRLDVVQSFFRPDGGLQVTATPAQMESGFVWACEYGRDSVVSFLLQQGIDLTAHANTGLTGLHWAVVGGQVETIKLLLGRGAPLEATNTYGGTVLGQAVWSAVHGDASIDYVPIVETLLAAGAKIDAVDYPTGSERLDEVLRRYGAKSPVPAIRQAGTPTVSDSADDVLERALQALRTKPAQDARQDLLRAIDFLRQHGTRSELAQALRGLGELERRLPDRDAALQHYEEAVAILRELDEPLRLAHTIRHLGDLHHDAGRAALAEPCYQEAVALYRGEEQARPLDAANAIRSLAVLKGEAGEMEEAVTLWRDAHDLYIAVGIPAGIAESAARLAILAWRQGDGVSSREWLRAATAAADASEEINSLRYVSQVKAMIEP